MFLGYVPSRGVPLHLGSSRLRPLDALQLNMFQPNSGRERTPTRPTCSSLMCTSKHGMAYSFAVHISPKLFNDPFAEACEFQRGTSLCISSGRLETCSSPLVSKQIAHYSLYWVSHIHTLPDLSQSIFPKIVEK